MPLSPPTGIIQGKTGGVCVGGGGGGVQEEKGRESVRGKQRSTVAASPGYLGRVGWMCTVGGRRGYRRSKSVTEQEVYWREIES